MKRRILSMLLALVMVISLLPATALAGDSYAVTVCGTAVTDVNKDDVLGEADGDGATVVYTPAAGDKPAKLTLNNANLTRDTRNIIQTTEDLEIELVGTNTITHGDDKSNAIFVGAEEVEPTLTITGAGSLNMSAICTKGLYPAIYAQGNIVIALDTDGVLTVDAGKNNAGAKNQAIYAKNSITIGGSGTVNAYSGAGNALEADGNITIGDSAVVNACSDSGNALNSDGGLTIKASAVVNISCNGTYSAAYVCGDLTITTSETVTVRTTGGIYHAIDIEGDITIGGSATVIANSAGGSALNAQKNLLIEGSANVTATSDEGQACAISCGDEESYEGDITIGGSANVTATSNSEYSTIWSYGNIELNTTGNVVAENSGACSALGCYDKLTVTKVGKLLLRGYSAEECGALELYGEEALVLPGEMAFFGSADRNAMEAAITTETSYEYVGGDWGAYSLYVGDDLAQAVMLRYIEHPADEHEGWTAWGDDTGETTKLPTAADSYYLTEDVTLDSTWTVPEGRVDLCLNGHVIKFTGETGSVITVPEGATLNLYDCDTTTKHYFNYVKDGAWTLNTTADDTAKTAAIGVSAIKAETETNTLIEVTGGCITGGSTTTNDNAGGVQTAGTVVMNGGSIVGNRTTYRGGGVYISETGSFTLNNGAAILGNIATGTGGTTGTTGGGGGVCVDGGTLEMNGGRMAFNYTKYAGGAVIVLTIDKGSFTMTGGEIAYNKADDNGGGVCMNQKFIMTGGSIEYNNAGNNGGGVRITSNTTSSSFTMTGGSITNNTASSLGGGAHVDGILTLGGSAKITDNTAGAEGSKTANNLYLNTDKTITLGDGTNAPTGNMEVGVTLSTGTGKFTNTAVATDTAYFFSDNTAYADKHVTDHLELVAAQKITVDSTIANGSIDVDSSAYATETVTLTVTPSDGYKLTADSLLVKYNDGAEKTITPQATQTTGEYTFTMPAYAVTVTAAFEEAHTHTVGGETVTFQPWNDSTKLPTSGSYYLNTDVTLSAACYPGTATINLCLNGHVIDVNGYSMAYFYANQDNCVYKLNIFDCGNVVHNFTVNAETGLWTLDDTNGTEELTGGVITGGDGGDYGPILNLANSNKASSIVMNGGNIVGNRADDYKGVINAGGGEFILNAGNIIGNVNSSSEDAAIVRNGGGSSNSDGHFIMNGGTISNNRVSGSDLSAILSNYSGIIRINNGEISNNTAVNGSIINCYYGSGAQFFMTGGTIKNNNAKKNTVSLTAAAKYCAITGGTITGNTSDGDGAGIFIGNANTFFGGKAVISGNTKSGTPTGTNNNVYADKTFAIGTGTGDGGNEVAVPETGMNVGVTKAANGAITTNGSESDIQYFEPDDTSKYIKFNTNHLELADLPTYSISTGGVTHGTVTASPTSAVAGATVTLTVTPDEGYQFKADTLKATYSDGSTHELTLTPDQNDQTKYTFTDMPPYEVTVTAEFEGIPYGVTNGTPLSSKDANHGYITIDKETAIVGDTVTVTVYPDEEYQIATQPNYRIGENQTIGTVDSGDPKKYTFTMPAQEISISATFEVAKPIFDPCNGEAPTQSATAPETNPTLPGCTFVGWFDAPVGGNPVTTGFATGKTYYARWKVTGSDNFALTLENGLAIVDGTLKTLTGFNGEVPQYALLDTTVLAEKYGISYNSDSNTLALNNAAILAVSTEAAALSIPGADGANITVTGTNQIGGGTDEVCLSEYGIYREDGTLEITGTDSTDNLTIFGNCAGIQATDITVDGLNCMKVRGPMDGGTGIYATEEDITLQNCKTIDVAAKYGIYTYGNIVFQDCDDVLLKEVDYYPLYGKTITVKDCDNFKILFEGFDGYPYDGTGFYTSTSAGGLVSITGSNVEIVDAYYDFYGYSVSITDSTLKTSGAYYGFYNYGNVSLTGCSKIDMTDVYYCVDISGNLTVSDCADVSFTATYDGYYGIYCTDASITNSKVKTQGEGYGACVSDLLIEGTSDVSAIGADYGIYAANVNITGGKVSVTTGEDGDAIYASTLTVGSEQKPASITNGQDATSADITEARGVIPGGRLKPQDYTNPVVIQLKALSEWSQLGKALSADTPATVDGVFAVSENNGTYTFKLLKDITAEDGDVRFVVPAGKNVILDLNGFTLDRGLKNENAAVDKGNVFTVNGKLTIQDNSTAQTGTISGGTSAYGAAIISNGETVLESGSITDCKALSEDYDTTNSKFGRGGAIYVPAGGKFTMTGGEIKNCSATVAGGAIFAWGGVVEITDGKISRCSVSGLDDGSGTVKAKGGAVYLLYAQMTMTGGEISGNTLSDVADMRGAGVYVATDAAITLGGTAKISGNTDGKGNTSNLFLYDGVTVTLGTGDVEGGNNVAVPATEDGTKMQVGVTMQTAGVFTGANGADYSVLFTPDAGADYKVINLTNDNNKLKLVTKYDMTVGTITNGQVTTSAANDGKAFEGDTVTITVTPSEGYQLTAGSLTATYNSTMTCELEQNTQDTTKYTFTMPAYAVTVSAAFEEIPKTTVTINATADGFTYGDSGKTGYKDASAKVNSTEVSGLAAQLIATYYKDNGESANPRWTKLETVPTDAGNYKVVLSVPESNETYTGSKDILFTIAKKAVTVKADNKGALVGDAMPTLTYTVTGLLGGDTLTTKPTLAYVSTPDMSKAGTVAITASGAEAGNNYTITYEDGTLTISNRPSSGGGSTPTVTVPVTGDKDSVKVQATVSGNTATVKNVTSEQLDKVGTGENVTIDLSSLSKSVSGVTIPKTTLENVAASDADGLEVKLPNGTTAVFDSTTVAAVAEQAAGSDIRLVVDKEGKAEQALTAAQKETVKELNDALVLDAYFVSNGKRISDFKGGEAELTVSYPTTKPVRVWYVASDGSKTLVPSTFDGKAATFVVTHFSHYAIEILDGSSYASCPKDATCPISKFTDTTANFWWHDGIHYCLDNGLMNGVSATEFAPNGTLTRGMVVTVLARLDGVEAGTGAAWYVPGQEWAVKNGISDGTNMTANITREQLATMLYRYAQLKKVDVDAFTKDTNTLSHNDVFTISDWATSGMHFCIAAGVVGGDDNGNLNPHNTATRAEAASMMQRFCEAIK